MISTEGRQEIVKKFAKHDKDTGSAEVQIALLSARIVELTEHFKIHRKDYAGLRGLQSLVVKRKSLLRYVKKHSEQRYLEVTGALGIRK